eukprot:2678537-Rhodomonas_salina.2
MGSSEVSIHMRSDVGVTSTDSTWNRSRLPLIGMEPYSPPTAVDAPTSLSLNIHPGTHCLAVPSTGAAPEGHSPSAATLKSGRKATMTVAVPPCRLRHRRPTRDRLVGHGDVAHSRTPPINKGWVTQRVLLRAREGHISARGCVEPHERVARVHAEPACNARPLCVQAAPRHVEVVGGASLGAQQVEAVLHVGLELDDRSTRRRGVV